MGTLMKRNRNTQPAFGWTPFDNFFDRVFEDFLPNTWHLQGNTFGRLNVIENEDGIGLEVNLPGIKKENISLEVVDDLLQIKVNRNDEQKIEEKNYVRREWSHASMDRNYYLPEGLDNESIDAKFDNGILYIDFKWAEKPKPDTKKIEIK